MNALQFFTSVEGRITRQQFWLGIVVITFVGSPIVGLTALAGGATAGAIVNLAFLWCGFAISVKRAHDRDRHYLFVAAYFALVAIVTSMGATETKAVDKMASEQQTLFAIVSLIFLGYMLFLFVDLGLRRGTEGANKYGPDPLQQ